MIFRKIILWQSVTYLRYSMFYYLCVRRTGVAAPESRVAGRVLQAKTGFVSLGHFAPSNGVQQVVVTEGVHAVVVSVWNRAGQIFF